MSEIVITTKTELIELIGSIIAPFFELKEKPKPEKIQSRYLTRKEVAELFNISLPTLQKHTDSGLLKAVYIGRRVLYDQNELSKSVDAVNKTIYKRVGKTINKNKV